MIIARRNSTCTSFSKNKTLLKQFVSGHKYANIWSDFSRASRNNFAKCCYIVDRKIKFSPVVLIFGSRTMVAPVEAFIVTCALGLAVGLLPVTPASLFLYFVLYQQTYISKTVLASHARWDIGHLNAQQWLQRLTFDGNCVEQLYSVQPLPCCVTVLINVPFNKSFHHSHI